MKTNNPIIISIDAFDVDYNLINYGVEIAKAFDKFIVLHSTQYAVAPVEPDAVIGRSTTQIVQTQEMYDNAEGEMEKLCERVQKDWAKTSYSFEIGFKSDQTIRTANEQLAAEPFLLLVTKKSHYSLLGEMFGTTETAIAQYAHCPVMVVPENRPFTGFHNVLYTLDKGKFDVANLQFLASLVKPWKGYLAVIYLSDSDFTNDEMNVVQQCVQDEVHYDIDFFHSDSIADASQASEMGKSTFTDLFAFPQRHAGFFKRIFNNDNTKRLILKSEMPVLVF